MLFYFHYFYSFPFNVISVATVLCFCGFHPPVVSTFSWFPPFHGFHPVWLLCGLHPPVVCIFPWLLHGVPFMVCTFVVYTLLWFPPSRGSPPPCGHSVVSLLWFALSWFTLCRGFHPPVVCIFVWFPPSLWLLRGVPFMVCTITWFTLCCGFHPPVVCIIMWFPPSCGYSVVSILDFGLN